MKKTYFLVSFFFIIISNSLSYSQDLSLGVASGLNISDIHGNESSGKWVFNPGPVQGISMEYSFLKLLSLKTGVDYSTVYYEYKSYNESGMIYYGVSYPCCSWPSYDYRTLKMNFSSLTIPLQLSLAIPSNPRLSISAGMYYSNVLKYSLEYRSSEKPAMNDLGFVYSAGLTYPVNDRINASLTGRYLIGEKRFIKDMNYRHGSYDISVGLSYKLFAEDIQKHKVADTLEIDRKVTLIYRGGINFSRNNPDSNQGKYSMHSGPSVGFLLNYKWKPKVSFRTGILYSRMGYGFKDSSDYFFRYAGDNNKSYFVDSRVSVDYISIPALVNIYIGKSDRLILYSGPSFGIKLNAICTGTAYSVSKYSSDYIVTETKIYDDIGRKIKGNDFGWLIGAGYTIPVLKILSIELSVQYYQGFSDIYDNSNTPEVNVPAINGKVLRNQSLTLNAGVIVPLYKK
jgi:opacity protein-like surface antigen